MRLGTWSPLVLALLISAPMHAAPPALTQVQTEDDAKRRAAELDARFIELFAAKSEDEADPIVAEIWSLWMQSGRADVDQLVRQSVQLFHGSAQSAALDMLDEVIKRAPDYAEGWNKRATLLYLMGEFGRSKADCAEVLKREPRHFGALAGLGMIAIAEGDYKAALAAYRRALAANPYLKGRNEIIPALVKELEGEKL